jgi:cephalosporin hydroxylase
VTTAAAETVADKFHGAYYRSNVWQDTNWMGVPIFKAPSDMVAYAEIIHETKPDLIIETGTCYGGSALFFANMMDIVGRGKVITIDIHQHEQRPKHPRITYAQGSSSDPDAVAWLTVEADGRRTMVVLDSDHRKRHVLAELEAYAPLVSQGHYLVVEDTNVNGHPVDWKQGPGPMEALEEWLPDHPEFKRDARPERFMLTFNPSGWLCRREE